MSLITHKSVYKFSTHRHHNNFESLATCSYVNIIRLFDDVLSILWGFPLKLDQICKRNYNSRSQCNRSTTIPEDTSQTTQIKEWQNIFNANRSNWHPWQILTFQMLLAFSMTSIAALPVRSNFKHLDYLIVGCFNNTALPVYVTDFQRRKRSKQYF